MVRTRMSHKGLGRVITRWRGLATRWPVRKHVRLLHVRIAAINGLMPMMFMTRVRL